MADVAAPAPAPAKKAVKAKKAAVAKKPAAHPKYVDMIAAAISSLKDRKGSSGMAIKKYIVANYKVDEKSVGPHVRLALKRGVVSGSLKQVKGTGASGSFKLAEKPKVVKAQKSPAKAKKPAAKKAAKSPKKAAKKPAVKKAAAKKSPKKSIKKAKAPAAKKPVAKKAKKPSAKKAEAKK